MMEGLNVNVEIVTPDSMIDLCTKSGIPISELAWSWERAESKNATLFVAYPLKLDSARSMKLVLPKALAEREDIRLYVMHNELAWLGQ